MRRTLPWIAAALLGIGAGLGVAACGDDEVETGEEVVSSVTSEASTASTSTTTATSTTGSTTTPTSTIDNGTGGTQY